MAVRVCRVLEFLVSDCLYVDFSSIELVGQERSLLPQSLRRAKPPKPLRVSGANPFG